MNTLHKLHSQSKNIGKIPSLPEMFYLSRFIKLLYMQHSVQFCTIVCSKSRFLMLSWHTNNFSFCFGLYRTRFSTSNKCSSPALPSWELLWLNRLSTCFSSKWKLNWNRLKTNWNKPKMNWVPGNLRLIGKQTKILPSQDFPDNPTARILWWDGQVLVLHTKTQTLVSQKKAPFLHYPACIA